MAKEHFKEFQRFDRGTRFHWVWGMTLAVALGAAAVLGFYARRLLAAGHSKGWGLLAAGILVIVYSGVVPAITGFVTEVREDGLYWRIWPNIRSRGMPRGPRKIPLDDLVHYAVSTYSPAWQADGKVMDCLVTKGQRGVFFAFGDGTKLFLGSQKPEELARWVQRLLRRRNST